MCTCRYDVMCYPYEQLKFAPSCRVCTYLNVSRIHSLEAGLTCGCACAQEETTKMMRDRTALNNQVGRCGVH